ncbi:MAG TPA: hypothetical protein VNK52_12340 [Hyphomicrobiaceae bacterium]|nr:hypothetical protein [Hyphomicrobiaceae bacterium]
MAIGAIHLAWLKRLAERRSFQGLVSVLDLGPQDVQIERPVLEAAMRGLTPPRLLARLLHELYPDGRVSRTGQKAFYGLFGLTSYASIDLEDGRANYRLDLNAPVDGLPEFDVVTNFGTAEHIFNIGEALRTVHKLTRPGGLSLHCLPSFAFINHGFYAVHPNALIEMARVNRYDLVDFSYFDNAFVRNVRLGREGLAGFTLDSLPIGLADMVDTQAFMTKVVDRFYENLRAVETRCELAALSPLSAGPPAADYPSRAYHLCFVFDLAFVAMRRPAERQPFVMPLQDPGGVAPLAGPPGKAASSQ